jgi:hypothetical protein
MPNDFDDFQAELALLRRQVQAHRLEIDAAIEKLASRGAAASGDDCAAMQARSAAWQRREVELGERIAASTVEYQALRARAELERERQELRVAELEKRLAGADQDNEKLHSVLQALMAEHANCATQPPPGLPDDAKLRDLEARLASSELECAKLRHSIESSVALKLARSIPWLLGPVRSLLAKRDTAAGEKL